MLLVATEAALKAGALLHELFEQPHQIHHKSTIDLVTDADLASEELILDILQHNLPGIKILSEESFASYDTIPAEPVWIIDPLDGTTNFAHNFPWFAVSIALYAGGRSQVGIIYNPIQKELFCATLAGGAWLNDRPIKVSDVSSLQNALVATGFPYDVRDRSDCHSGYAQNCPDTFAGGKKTRCCRTGSGISRLRQIGRILGDWP